MTTGGGGGAGVWQPPETQFCPAEQHPELPQGVPAQQVPEDRHDDPGEQQLLVPQGTLGDWQHTPAMHETPGGQQLSPHWLAGAQHCPPAHAVPEGQHCPLHSAVGQHCPVLRTHPPGQQNCGCPLTPPHVFSGVQHGPAWLLRHTLATAPQHCGGAPPGAAPHAYEVETQVGDPAAV